MQTNTLASTGDVWIQKCFLSYDSGLALNFFREIFARLAKSFLLESGGGHTQYLEISSSRRWAYLVAHYTVTVLQNPFFGEDGAR